MKSNSNEVKLDREQENTVEAMLSGRNVFLTGDAGTGKSTVIEAFKRRCDKQLVCLAPTGMAATNIGASTIHSFFKFPTGVLTSDQLKPLAPQHAELLREIEVIIVDEISMVRSDVFLLTVHPPYRMQGVIKVLCKVSERSEKFGIDRFL